MSKINFAGWVLKDSEDVLLKVVSADLQRQGLCDVCGGPARYNIVLPDGGSSPVCQADLEKNFEDPRSPDVFYAPANGAQVVEYSDGGQQLVVSL